MIFSDMYLKSLMVLNHPAPITHTDVLPKEKDTLPFLFTKHPSSPFMFLL